MSVNLVNYVDSVRETLKPPVSNKILFDGDQIKVMVVGGPNQRKDFHVEKGEELFYMLIGDMDLDIMEDGELKRIPIKEGEFFLLPSCVPHSPQRYENTIGIVFERERFAGEMDCLRWYVPDGTVGRKSGDEVLYEEMFHCTDLGTQIKAVIERFNESKSSGFEKLPEKVDFSIEKYFQRPDQMPSAEFFRFTLNEKVESLSSSILDDGQLPKPETPINSEFRVDLISNTLPVALNCDVGGEVFLWQQSGVSEIYESELESTSHLPATRQATKVLRAGEVVLLKRRLLSNSTPILISQMESGGVVLCVSNSSILPPN